MVLNLGDECQVVSVESSGTIMLSGHSLSFSFDSRSFLSLLFLSWFLIEFSLAILIYNTSFLASSFKASQRVIEILVIFNFY